MTEDQREAYEERAAIIEFDGNVDRASAERAARRSVFGDEAGELFEEGA